MIGWLIYNKHDAARNKSYIEWFIEEASFQDIHLRLIFRESLIIGIIKNKKNILYQRENIEMPDFAVVRVMEPTLNMHLEASGIPVFNNHTISLIANNKIRTHDIIHSLGVPMVDTVFIRHSAIPNQCPLPFPVVLKDANSRGGKDVYLIRNQLEWDQKTNGLGGTDFIVQSSHVQCGIDIRVFVVGKEIVGAIKRMNKQDFRANYTLGGTITWYCLQKDEIEMIERIMAYFDFGMVGIDFLIDEHGELSFNEIEDIVGSRSLSQVSDINILRKYVSHIKNKITNQHSI